MIDKITTISIKGRCFQSKTSLSFFCQPDQRIAIVYGKNGAGKSTVSEGVRALTTAVPSDISASLLDLNGQPIPTTDLAKNVFVFNERYIDENVKIDDDGLGTIVLFGGQVDLQEEIDQYDDLTQKSFSESEAAQNTCNQFLQATNPVSPLYHLERIKATLKQSGGWAETDSTIKGNRRNSSVTDDVINEICALSPTKTMSALQDEFREAKELLDKVSDNSNTFPSPITQIFMQDKLDERICELLAKKIDQPVLTEREQLILATIQAGNQTFVEKARADFSQSSTATCPYCYQPITESYKHNLLESIHRVLNQDVDLHKAELAQICLEEIRTSYEQYLTLDSALVEEILLQIRSCNELIAQYSTALSTKTGNIYTPIDQKNLGLISAVTKLNTMLSALEAKRLEFNDASLRKKKLVNKLIEINKHIAHQQIAQSHRDYIAQQKEQRKAQKVYEAKQKKYQETAEYLSMLLQRKANTGLAINSINNALDYVFFSHGRLSIELKNDKYYLKSNGQNVLPKNVSLGERNVIALCYFFTQIMNNQEVNKLYESESLIIIDDPVSSFDFENKVGIMSFIRYQINRIVTGNKNSKVLILSHDLASVFHFQKAATEICTQLKGIAQIPKTTFITYELTCGQLFPFNKNRNEYGELLTMIYQFANGEIDEKSLLIGNVMRRALEAFSTFTYRKNIENVSCDTIVLKALGDHSLYFENLMYRLIMHGESHYEEQVYNMHDNLSFYQFISLDEKKRTAKDVLCFMYLLNPSHVEAYLISIGHSIESIKGWVKKLPRNSSFEIKPKRTVPFYCLPLSAGIGNSILESDTCYDEYETENTACDFALKISGNSMEPDIPDGSTVLVKRCQTLQNGEIGAIFYNGEVYCKKWKEQQNRVFLESINSAYPDIELTEDHPLKIYGKIVAID